MFKKSCPFNIRYSLYENGKDFWTHSIMMILGETGYIVGGI